MCGIVGVIGDIDYRAKKAFKDMLHMDILRGAHSIGIASANLIGDFNYHKRAMLPSDFFELKLTGEVINDNTNTCLIGHNRYATVGKVNNNTAHPFECGDLLGFHNGTLKSRANLLDYSDYAVDSENLYHNMDNLGLQDTFDKMSKSVSNAWSLVWLDKAKQTLNLLRNEDRPMCYCFSEDGKTMFFASEWWMLEGALWRNGIKHKTVYITNVGEHYELELPKVKGGAVSFTRTKMVRTPSPEPTKKADDKVTKLNTSGSSLEERQRVFKNMLMMKGKEVTFAVDATPTYSKAKNGQEYFDCSLLVDSTINLRVYMQQKDLISNAKKADCAKLLADSVNYFTGSVRKVCYNSGNPYLVIDWRTIVEEVIDLSDEDLGETHTNLGECAWCSDPLTPETVVQDNVGNCFCKHCVEDPHTNQTLVNMGYQL